MPVNSVPAIQSHFIVVVPAAGVGSRMGADRPKQYLSLAGKTLLDRTLHALLAHPRIDKLLVAIDSDDKYWAQSGFCHDQRVSVVEGGLERCDSVLNALRSLQGQIDQQDWVMVHDVVRPLVQLTDLDCLFNGLADCEDGLVLGMPVHDTMKRTDISGRVVATVNRDLLWHAFTPQIFRLGQLISALDRCLSERVQVTDESSAMEYCGFNPVMLQGSITNIKITRPDDLQLAERLIKSVQG